MKAVIRMNKGDHLFTIDQKEPETPEVVVDLSPEQLADYAEISMKHTAMQNHLRELYIKTPEPEERE